MKIGTRIRIDNMEGEPHYNGREGVVEYIDDIGQIHGTWGGCAIQPEHDSFIILESKQKVPPGTTPETRTRTSSS